MWRIALGAVLLVIGLGTLINALVKPEGFWADATRRPENILIWTGGIIEGVRFIVRGLRIENWKQKGHREALAIALREPELRERLGREEGIDRIAAEFHTAYGIPVMRTFMYAALAIKDWVQSEDPQLRDRAARLIARQEVDGAAPPEAFLDRLSFDQTVFLHDESAKARRVEPTPGESTEGTLILSTAFLYFLTKKGDTDWSELWDKLADIPGIGLVFAAIGLLLGIHSELRNPYTPQRIARLKKRLRQPPSFAVPLAEVAGMQPIVVKFTTTTSAYLEVEQVSADGRRRKYWLEAPARKGTGDWVAHWTKRIQIACIAEGRLLMESAPQRRLVQV